MRHESISTRKKLAPRAIITGQIDLTSVVSANITITYPTQCTPDTTLIQASSAQRVGDAWAVDVTGNIYDGTALYNNATTFFFGGPNTGAQWSATVPFTWDSGDRISYEVIVPCTGWTSETGFTPEQVGWRVDANISGANPSLGTSAVSSYTGITNGGLTLTNNTGSGVLTAQIPCSSTNSPSGTTCSAGDESVGVSFNMPVAGDVEACVAFAHFIENGASGVVNAAFQIVETASNAQTVIQEGKDRLNSQFGTASTNITIPNRLCGTFSFSSAGQKTLRLMYEQTITATVNSNNIIADGSTSVGQRDIHWTVKPINQQVPAPLLVGSVTSNSTGLERVERAEILCSASSATSNESGDWVSSVANAVDGGANRSCAITIRSGMFAATPVCTFTHSTSAPASVGVTATSATAITVHGPDQDFAGYLHCIGPR